MSHNKTHLSFISLTDRINELTKGGRESGTKGKANIPNTGRLHLGTPAINPNASGQRSKSAEEVYKEYHDKFRD